MRLVLGGLSGAFLEGRVTVLRKDWLPDYADLFPVGSEHIVWSKQARYGGNELGVVRIEKNYTERIDRLLTNKQYGLEEIKRMGFGAQDIEQVVDGWLKRGCMAPVRLEWVVKKIFNERIERNGQHDRTL